MDSTNPWLENGWMERHKPKGCQEGFVVSRCLHSIAETFQLSIVHIHSLDPAKSTLDTVLCLKAVVVIPCHAWMFMFVLLACLSTGNKNIFYAQTLFVLAIVRVFFSSFSSLLSVGAIGIRICPLGNKVASPSFCPVQTVHFFVSVDAFLHRVFFVASMQPKPSNCWQFTNAHVPLNLSFLPSFHCSQQKKKIISKEKNHIQDGKSLLEWGLALQDETHVSSVSCLFVVESASRLSPFVILRRCLYVGMWVGGVHPLPIYLTHALPSPSPVDFRHPVER